MRLRHELGWFHWNEWEECLNQLGMLYMVADDRLHMRAVLYDNVVVLKDPHSVETAQAVWHEIGHKLLHAGSCTFWHSRPAGHLYVGKFERQADEFADLFPIWD